MKPPTARIAVALLGTICATACQAPTTYPSAAEIARARCGAEPIRKEDAQEYLDEANKAAARYGRPPSKETLEQVRSDPSALRIGETAWGERWANWNVCYLAAKLEADEAANRRADEAAARLDALSATSAAFNQTRIDLDTQSRATRAATPPPAPVPIGPAPSTVIPLGDAFTKSYLPMAPTPPTPAERLLERAQAHDCAGVGAQ
jgi:hypothetical protein